MSEKNTLPVKKPEIGRKVKAVLKIGHKWSFHTDSILVAVDEPDCDWRFADDAAELSYDWDVIYWEYVD